MRGRRLGALALSLALLSGCGWMDGSYVSVTPHQVGVNQTAESHVLSVRGYTQLRDALIGLVDEGSTEGLFSLAEYPRENVLSDMERAVEYVTRTYPIGAYAVESIDYDFGTGLGSSAMSVDITYRHSREMIENIRTVRWISGAEEALADALDACEQKLVLQISGYRETDFAALARAYALENPDRVMEQPGITVRVWPDRGDTRVVEILFIYRTDREALRAMREQVQPVFSSAALYVSGQAEERNKFQQLHTFLMERSDYTYRTSVTPAYSLLCEGVGDSRAFSQVYAAMCSRIRLEAMTVAGTRAGEKHQWNMIRIDGIWYHLDLLASAQFRPMTDEEMIDYEWDRAAYPRTGTPAG